MACVHMRPGQQTDNVPAQFTGIGREVRRLPHGGWADHELYRCECGQMWALWYIGGAFLWSPTEETLSKERRKAGWTRTYKSPPPTDMEKLSAALAEFRAALLAGLPRWLRRLWRLEVK